MICLQTKANERWYKAYRDEHTHRQNASVILVDEELARVSRHGSVHCSHNSVNICDVLVTSRRSVCDDNGANFPALQGDKIGASIFVGQVECVYQLYRLFAALTKVNSHML